MSKKLLLTGATGFLGHYILKELEKPQYDTLDIDEIHLFVRTPSKAENLTSEKYQYKIVKGDLMDHQSIKDAVEEVDYIVHVAALYDTSSKYDRFYKANVEATEVLMNSISAETEVVLTSTYGVYGFTNEEFPITEDYVNKGADPYWHYQETKAEQEKTAFAIAERRGIKLIAIRPPTIFGPGDLFFVPNFIENLKSKNLFLLRKRDGVKGGNVIPFAHVEDVAKAHGLALLNVDDHSGQAYHMKSFESTFKDFVDQWSEELGVDKITTKVPYGLAYFIGWMGEFLPFMEGYSRFSVKYLGSHTILDQSKIIEELDYSPGWNLENSVRETVEWYQEENPEKRA